MQAIYTATATSTGGREGRSTSSDNRLSVKLSTPTELGGPGGEGTNPEQLFAAGYSACFIGAMKHVAGQQNLTIPEPTVTAKVGIGEHPKGVGFNICVDLEVQLRGLERELAEKLLEDTHQICPYSNATRGNIDITTTIS